ncbi:DNA-binding protein [Mycobacterium avium subsp. hominissuis]|uniref:DNA-binding protein n=1 Tax=Mycobacterium avium TaxID=1764 RepID=A0A2A2ZD29_MYCAV|nr:DNA-binding protein [Mycobacterium avium]PBD11826.1 DNA-binding protein [Mycobacterium avium subsp. hominissuis]PBA39362.1 DNA-binding protein [Mycobacterium avium]PBA44375.1 DNA-binding protein [Mycobacterium avium]PBA48979.1 DNA-binding protein [Mycobacterium avium]
MIDDEHRHSVSYRQEQQVAVTQAERLYTVDQAARILGCGRGKIYAMIREGEIRSVKIGKLRRIPASALKELADGE